MGWERSNTLSLKKYIFLIAFGLFFCTGKNVAVFSVSTLAETIRRSSSRAACDRHRVMYISGPGYANLSLSRQSSQKYTPMLRRWKKESVKIYAPSSVSGSCKPSPASALATHVGIFFWRDDFTEGFSTKVIRKHAKNSLGVNGELVLDLYKGPCSASSSASLLPRTHVSSAQKSLPGHILYCTLPPTRQREPQIRGQIFRGMLY